MKRLNTHPAEFHHLSLPTMLESLIMILAIINSNWETLA